MLMNTTEEMLADALDAAAETIRPGTLRPLPRAGGGTRFRAKVWNTRLAPIAAAAAVLLAVGVAFGIPGLARSQHHQLPAAVPHAGSGPAGPALAPLPRYYAEVEGNISHGPRFVVVRSVGTGAVVAQVPSPVDAGHKQLYAVDVTTRDDHRFYVLYSENRFTGNGDFMVYSFTLSPAGTVTEPAEVPGGLITGQYYLALDGGFAVSPDGTELAIATANPAVKGIPQALAEQIVLIDTRTGARATWKGGLDRAGSLFNLENLSWTADSGTLIYLAQWCPQGASYQGSAGVGCMAGFSSEQVRELSVSSGGGLLTSGRVLLRSSARIPYIGAALIDPDGTDLTALVGLGGTSLQVVTIDVGTGKTQRVLYRLPADEASVNQISQFHLGLDSTGSYVLLAANPVHGRLSGGHLETLPPRPWDGTPATW
jgi:hypothetical protein